MTPARLAPLACAALLLLAPAAAQPQAQPAPQAVKPAPAKPSPRLRPWAQRFEPRAIGAVWGAWVTAQRGLELGPDVDPALAKPAAAALARRDTELSKGVDALRAIIRGLGEDPDALTKTVLTPETDAKLRNTLRAGGLQAVTEWENFERDPRTSSVNSVLVALQQNYGEDPSSAGRLTLLTPATGRAVTGSEALTAVMELPASWAQLPVSGPASIRAVSGGGMGDETLTILLASIGQDLTPEQEENFFTLTLDASRYESAPGAKAEVREIKVGDRRAVEATLRAPTDSPGMKGRTVIRQVIFLHEKRWTVTVQMMVSLNAPAAGEAPDAELVEKRLKNVAPVLDKALASARFSVSKVNADPAPQAPK